MHRLLASVFAASIFTIANGQTTVNQGQGRMTGVPWQIQGSTSTFANPVPVTLPPYQVGAFGEVLVSEDTPNVTLSFNYSINPYFVTTTAANGGSITQSNSKAVLQTSTATNGSATLESKAAIRYTPGQGVSERHTTIFSPCVADSQQEEGIGDNTDGFFFACQGATFGVIRRQNGSDTFTAQSAWNIDRMDGTGPSGQTLDITRGNVYFISYQWLGFGAISFYIENSNSGAFQLVHVLRYSNLNTNPSIFNPTLPLHARVVNSGNATNLTLQTASMGAYLQGQESKTGAPGSAGNQKTVAAETSIITIRNNATFQGKTNRVRVRLTMLNSLTTADTVIRVLLNTTLGGVPSFTDFDTTTSVMSFDVAGTTVTGGRQLMRITSAKATLDLISLESVNIVLNPGDTVTFTAATGTADINIMWREEFGG